MQRKELLRPEDADGLEALVRPVHPPILEHEAPGAHPARNLGEERDVLLVVPFVEVGDVLAGDIEGDGAHERAGRADVIRVASFGRMHGLVEGVRAMVYEGEAAEDVLLAFGEGIDDGGVGGLFDGVRRVDIVDGDI